MGIEMTGAVKPVFTRDTAMRDSGQVRREPQPERKRAEPAEPQRAEIQANLDRLEKTYLAFGPRWVGGAMAACPEDVPWQRVINSKGEISPRPGAQSQRTLLEQEGVEFNERGRIDLKRYRWEPEEDWCRANDLIPPPAKPRQETLL